MKKNEASRRTRIWLLVLLAAGIASLAVWASFRSSRQWEGKGQVLRTSGVPAEGVSVQIRTLGVPPPVEYRDRLVWNGQLLLWLRAMLRPRANLLVKTDSEGAFDIRVPAGGVYVMEIVEPSWVAYPEDLSHEPSEEPIVMFADPENEAPAWLRHGRSRP